MKNSLFLGFTTGKKLSKVHLVCAATWLKLTGFLKGTTCSLRLTRAIDDNGNINVTLVFLSNYELFSFSLHEPAVLGLGSVQRLYSQSQICLTCLP